MEQEFTTPMMKQYFEIKKQYQDCLLFYRMGDFYELFLEDANIGARVLNITLTSRARGKDGRIPMAGVPYHAVDSYLSKLVKAGYKVAICEQISLPNKYGLIDREVIRIVTPGTLLDEKALDKKENNYIMSLLVKNNIVAFTTADISTGYFSTIEIEAANKEQILKDELSRIHPAECILPDSLYNDPQLLALLKSERQLNIFPFPDWDSYANDAKRVLKDHFAVTTLESFAVEDKPLALQTAAALLGYLKNTQKGPVTHIKKIITTAPINTLILDKSTILNLELFSTIREHDTRGSLLNVIDQTVTAMGSRLLKSWIRKPLANKEQIEKRHTAVETIINTHETWTTITENIKDVSDIERLLSRLSVGLGNARDLVNLKNSLKLIIKIKKQLSQIPTDLILDIQKNIKPEIEEIINLIEKNIVDESPISIREGGMIKSGIHNELDKLRKIVGGSRDWILELEQQEREKTGISSLKVRFNQVFGFYIEVSKSNLHLVPPNYMRKQTLVNGERFITPELKKQEEIILTAEEKINEIEFKLFQETLSNVLQKVIELQDAAQSIAILDCLCNFATIAEKNNYVRPRMVETEKLHLQNGRHPVVEKLLEEQQFVPNTIDFDTNTQQLILLTGPNMAGKSVFIRQIALIVLMAQIGSFVPAEQAEIGIVDRIFVRSGASDVITSGLSTFMVEMVETAHILHHATKKSLIIMDEIGRGTSTYDGISIAWAVAEYLVTHLNPSPKTLFATHYHELQVLEQQYPVKIKNFHMAVSEEKGSPIFLHILTSGGASHSFGVEVAKLAGIPDPVVTRAKQLLAELEKRNTQKQTRTQSSQQINLAEHIIHKELEEIDIHQMTPLEALNKLADLKNKLKLFDLKNKKLLELD